MTDDISALFTLVEIAEQVGFSFEDPGEHLNEDGVWRYQLEIDDDYGWIMAGPGEEPFETSYPGWGEIEVEPFRLVPFVNGAVAGILTPQQGSLGGMLGLELYPDELEDHLIAKYCDELEYLGGDPSEWREIIDGDPLDDRDSLCADGGETPPRQSSGNELEVDPASMSICEGSWPIIIATHVGSYSRARSILITGLTSSNDAHTVRARRQRSRDDVVEDYEEWKAVVEELAHRRAESGSQGSRLFRSPRNPNEVAVLCEWESEQKAREFIDEVVPRTRWEKARVYSYELQFLEYVEDLEA